MKVQPKQIFRHWFTGPVVITNQSFKRWHVTLAVLFAVQAAAILLFGVAHDVPVMVSYLIKDSLQSQLMHQTVIAPAVRQLFMLNIGYVLAVYLLMMAAWHLLSATALCAKYEVALKQRILRVRWIVYGVVLALMLVSIALVAGVYNVDVLVGVAVFGVLSGIGGLAGEVANARPAKRDAQLRIAAIVAATAVVVLPVAAIVLFAVATGLYGNTVAPAVVYGMLATIALWIAAVVANMGLMRQKRGKWGAYVYGERWYLVLAVVFPSLLAWEAFVAVLRP